MGRKTAKPMPGKKGEAKPAWVGHYATVGDMVVECITELPKDDDQEFGEIVVIAEDEKGFYATTTAWLDRKFADPNRYARNRNKFTKIEDVMESVIGIPIKE